MISNLHLRHTIWHSSKRNGMRRDTCLLPTGQDEGKAVSQKQNEYPAAARQCCHSWEEQDPKSTQSLYWSYTISNNCLPLMIFKTHIMHPNNIDMGEFISCVARRTKTMWLSLLQHPNKMIPRVSFLLLLVWQCLSYCFTTTIADLGLSPEKSIFWALP